MEGLQEVDLITEAVHLGLQIYFVHVGGIYILRMRGERAEKHYPQDREYSVVTKASQSNP